MANPIPTIALDRSVVNQLITPFKDAFKKAPYYPMASLPDVSGYGIYFLYLANTRGTPYDGVVTPLSPLYIGKASPVQRSSGHSTKALIQRLKKHVSSIEQADNLDLDSFLCRILPVGPGDADFVSVIESYFITHFSPLWNTRVTGFGINPPGKGRIAQSLSAWDTLHPGRYFTHSLTNKSHDQKDLLSRLHLTPTHQPPQSSERKTVDTCGK